MRWVYNLVTTLKELHRITSRDKAADSSGRRLLGKETQTRLRNDVAQLRQWYGGLPAAEFAP
jgi:hypothetical protein